MTASTPGRSMQASRLVDVNAILYCSANFLPLSSVRLAIDTISTSGIFASALAWISPMAPVPAKQIFMQSPSVERVRKVRRVRQVRRVREVRKVRSVREVRRIREVLGRFRTLLNPLEPYEPD